MFKKVFPNLKTTFKISRVKPFYSLIKPDDTFLNLNKTSFNYPSIVSFAIPYLNNSFSTKVSETAIDECSEEANSIIQSSDISKPKEKTQAIKIELDEKDLVEKFIKGSGNGGQAINKTNSNVELIHIPTGIVVQCQKTRSQAQNRKLARKLLKQKLDDHFNGNLSKTSKKAAKVLKQRAKNRKRAKAKYNPEKNDSGEPLEESASSKNNV